MIPGVDTALRGVGTPTPLDPPHLGKMRSHPRILGSPTHVHLQQTGNDNGKPPGRYRPARDGNPDSGYAICGLEFVKPAVLTNNGSREAQSGR